MNSSYHVDTSYAASGKLTIIIIIVAIIILAAIIVSVIKLIKTGKINIGKNKPVEEVPAEEETLTTEEETYEEPVVAETLQMEDEGYEAPNFNDVTPQVNAYVQEPMMQQPQMPQAPVESVNTNMNMVPPTMPQAPVEPQMPQMNQTQPAEVNVIEPQQFLASAPQAPVESQTQAEPVPNVVEQPIVNNSVPTDNINNDPQSSMWPNGNLQ